jgi:hypothetical protein
VVDPLVERQTQIKKMTRRVKDWAMYKEMEDRVQNMAIVSVSGHMAIHSAAIRPLCFVGQETSGGSLPISDMVSSVCRRRSRR